MRTLLTWLKKGGRQWTVPPSDAVLFGRNGSIASVQADGTMGSFSEDLLIRVR